MRHVILTLMFLLCVCCCTACGKPAYWVKGLTLPPGSKEVSKTETEMTSANMPPIPIGGKFKRALMIGFSNPGGWPVVSAHIDQCMQKAGFTEGFQALGSMMGGMPGGGAQDAAMAGIMDTMRMYTKPGSQYMVMLQNMGGMMDFVKSQSKAPQEMPNTLGMMGMGEYNLMVILLEK